MTSKDQGASASPTGLPVFGLSPASGSSQSGIPSAGVLQTDRDAAADLLESGGSKGILCRFDHAITIRYTDQLDGDPYVRAFARHRRESQAELLAACQRIDAWLRDPNQNAPDFDGLRAAIAKATGAA